MGRRKNKFSIQNVPAFCYRLMRTAGSTPCIQCTCSPCFHYVLLTGGAMNFDSFYSLLFYFSHFFRAPKWELNNIELWWNVRPQGPQTKMKRRAEVQSWLKMCIYLVHATDTQYAVAADGSSVYCYINILYKNISAVRYYDPKVTNGWTFDLTLAHTTTVHNCTVHGVRFSIHLAAKRERKRESVRERERHVQINNKHYF